MDVILEDYKKKYTAIEIKTTKGKTREIFPLPNDSVVVTTQNYFEKIKEVIEGK